MLETTKIVRNKAQGVFFRNNYSNDDNNDDI